MRKWRSKIIKRRELLKNTLTALLAPLAAALARTLPVLPVRRVLKTTEMRPIPPSGRVTLLASAPVRGPLGYLRDISPPLQVIATEGIREMDIQRNDA